MARNLKAGDHITVDQLVKFNAKSEQYSQGLTRIEPGQVGKVISAAPQGRSSIVEFNGVRVVLSNQKLAKTEKPLGKKRGRKKKSELAAAESSAPKANSAALSAATNESSAQLITVIANSLLLNGGLKDDGDAVVELRFAELPENVRVRIRKLIADKLALN
ncbi:MAG: hypothetical protein KF726_09680 [Anaerolineae bacterium]|nr:hypothetical protein [Anaerolineae bacterium]